MVVDRGALFFMEIIPFAALQTGGLPCCQPYFSSSWSSLSSLSFVSGRLLLRGFFMLAIIGVDG
jgi:hypothetical protein